MTRIVRYILTFMLLVAQAALAAGQTQGQVLCIGADGHIAVEFPGVPETCCDWHGHVTHCYTTVSSLEQVQSKDCVDIPLGGEVTTTFPCRSISITPPAQQLLVFPPFAPGLLASSTSHPSGVRFERSYPPRSALAELRTVIILV